MDYYDYILSAIAISLVLGGVATVTGNPVLMPASLAVAVGAMWHGMFHNPPTGTDNNR